MIKTSHTGESPQLVAPRPLAPLAAELRSGQLPLRRYIEDSLERLDLVEPRLHCLLPESGRRERLLAEAAALESRWPNPAGPPLYGVLLGVKDLFAVDGFETRAGSNLPPALFAMAQSPVVTALQAAGALVLGKTVTTEFAYFSPGPTRNPHQIEHTPGGSSSGSAASIAAGLCSLALGTQTIGSIGRPAAFCGVCGWKPSYGRTAAAGLVPFSPSLDHVGLFAADVAGLTLAASLVAANWRPEAVLGSRSTLAKVHDGQPMAGLPVLAIPTGPYLEQTEPAALAAFEASLAWLANAGYPIKRLAAMPDIAAINERHRRIAAAELAITHRDWYPAHRSLYSATTAELIEKGLAISAVQLRDDLTGQLELRGELQRLLAVNDADCWLSPAAPGPAPAGIQATGSPLLNLPWTHAGLPSLVIPAGFAANGLPLGLQLATAFGSDEELLVWGESIATALV